MAWEAAVRSYVGTSGFSYPEWKGVFYPAGLAAGDFLSYYATQLSTVELNNTFYRMPRKSVLTSWREKTPEGFCFAVKASRRITHFKKLRETAELLGYLSAGLEELGPRLGPVLFQAPPTLRADIDLLRSFLDELDAHFRSRLPAARVVLEFRHESWLTGEVQQLLEQRNIALCANDGDDAGKVPAPLWPTVPWAYLRLRRGSYTDQELAVWVERLRKSSLEEAFVYFKHEESGPGLARRFQQLLAP